MNIHVTTSQNGRWTKEEKELLLELFLSGDSIGEIEKKITTRSPSAIHDKLQHLGDDLKTLANRGKYLLAKKKKNLL